MSYGQWRREPWRAPGQHNSWPPPPPTGLPLPRPRKIAIILCVCLCVCRYSSHNQIMPSAARPTFFLGGPPPYQNPGSPTDFLSKKKKKNPAWPGPPQLARAPGHQPPPPSTPLPMAAGVQVNHHDIRLEDLCFSVQCQRLYQKHCKPH